MKYTKTRVVKLSYPEEKQNLMRSLTSEVEVSLNVKTVYDTVAFFEKNIFPKIKKESVYNQLEKTTLLQDILNIHNDDGVKDYALIITMTDLIKTKKYVIHHVIPNIKLVKTKDSHLLLFDGHHSMLAYMAAGKTYLEEIPHIIIEDKANGYIDDEDITVFYGEHSKYIKNHDWTQKVINWQAAKEEQLCERVQKNMGELFSAIKPKIEFT